MCGPDVLTKAKEVNTMSDKKTKAQTEETKAEDMTFSKCMEQMMAACGPEMKKWMEACASNMSEACSCCCGTQPKMETTKTS